MNWLTETLKVVGVALGVLAPVVAEAASNRGGAEPPPAPSDPKSFADVDAEVDEEVAAKTSEPPP